MFLLDTNVLSHAAKPKQNPNVNAWFKQQTAIAIPFPAMVEIQQGIVELATRNPQKARELSNWFCKILATDYHYPEVTPAVAEKLAEMYCCRPLKNFWFVNDGKKQKKPGMDLFVAAMAIVHRIPVATLDGNDFLTIHSRFPLPGLYHPGFRTWLIPVPEADAPETSPARATA